MVDYSELKREIEYTKTIIFAIKESIKYSESQEEFDTYVEELSFREQSLNELRELVVN